MTLGPANPRPLSSLWPGRGEMRAWLQWLTDHLPANFPAPTHATPWVKLHESPAPLRVDLPKAP